MLVVVRHGRTALNAAGVLQGRVDPSLDEVGHRQADALAKRLGASAEIVVSSPLKRARETAALIAEVGAIEVVVDERWIELDYGEFDGRRLTDIEGDVWARWRADPTFAPAGGESLADLSIRVGAAATEWARGAVSQNLVIVTHVSPIKAVVAWALGVGVETSWRMRVDQASITRIAIGPNGPVLSSFNEPGHLG